MNEKRVSRSTGRIRKARPPVDATLAAIAEAQDGLFTRADAKQAEASQQLISRRVRSGRWCVVLPGVYRFAGTPPSRQMARRAALLWAGEGAVVSNVAAARLYGFKYLGEIPGETVEITVPLKRRLRHEGVAIHRSVVPKCDRRKWSGLAVTTPARTLIDIASLFDRDHLKRIVEGVLRDGRATVDELKTRIRRLGVSGRHGASVLASILDERSPNQPLTDSEGERLLLEAIGESGLPEPTHVHYAYSNEQAGLTAEMDTFWEDIALNVEVDHPATHGWETDIERDRARDNALVSVGVTVLRVTLAQLQQALPKTVLRIAQTMRRLYAERAARGGVSAALD